MEDESLIGIRRDRHDDGTATLTVRGDADVIDFILVMLADAFNAGEELGAAIEESKNRELGDQ